MSLIWTAPAPTTDVGTCPTCKRPQPGDKAQCDSCQKAGKPEPAPTCPDPECNNVAMVERECPVCDGKGGGKNHWGSASLDDGAWDCEFCEGVGKFWQCPECLEPTSPPSVWDLD